MQYRNNIGQFTFQLYLANIGGEYWANIGYIIGPILQPPEFHCFANIM